MNTKSCLILLFVLLQCLAGNDLLAQAPSLRTTASFGAGKKLTTGAWTLLSDKDDLIFQGQRGICNGQPQFWLKVENKSAHEVHVLVSVLLNDGIRSPKEMIILKPHQRQEFSCTGQKSMIMVHAREGTDPVVTLEYQINKSL